MELNSILRKSLTGVGLEKYEIIRLLNTANPVEQAEIFAAARAVRTRHFGNRIFLYGFIYFSTYCRNDCSFCYYRKHNDESPRYRKSTAETVQIATSLARSGVHLIDLTMGEDPALLGIRHFQELTDLVAQVKTAGGLPVMISPGLLGATGLRKLYKAGADWYALYQETHNLELYAKLRLNQSYSSRMAAKEQARRLGYLIEEGILLGVGETTADITKSIMTMQEMQVHQARVMSLVPQKGTPLSGNPAPPETRELLSIAVMRLALGDILIPASLDIEGITGLQKRLDAGANVVTSIIPPEAGLAGVSQSTLDIKEGYRSVAGVTGVLQQLGLQSATQAEYQAWLSRALSPKTVEAGVHDENRRYRWAVTGYRSCLPG